MTQPRSAHYVLIVRCALADSAKLALDVIEKTFRGVTDRLFLSIYHKLWVAAYFVRRRDTVAVNGSKLWMNTS